MAANVLYTGRCKCRQRLTITYCFRLRGVVHFVIPTWSIIYTMNSNTVGAAAAAAMPCLPPVNVTASWFREHGGGINISWMPVAPLPQPPVNRHGVATGCRRYVVEYSTVAHWVPLSGPLDAASTWFVWKTASRGATYHFRVVATEKDQQRPWKEDDEQFQGITSDVVSLDTGGRYSCLPCLEISCVIVDAFAAIVHLFVRRVVHHQPWSISEIGTSFSLALVGK